MKTQLSATFVHQPDSERDRVVTTVRRCLRLMVVHLLHDICSAFVLRGLCANVCVSTGSDGPMQAQANGRGSRRFWNLVRVFAKFWCVGKTVRAGRPANAAVQKGEYRSD